MIEAITPYLIGIGIILFGPILLVITSVVIYGILRILFHVILFGWSLPLAICGNKRAQKYIEDCGTYL